MLKVNVHQSVLSVASTSASASSTPAHRLKSASPADATRTPLSTGAPSFYASQQNTPTSAMRPASTSVPKTFTLPTYSTRVQPLLDSGNIDNDWHQFIEETAYYILACSDMKEKAEYALFGQQMIEKYPCVIHTKGPNEEPWVCNKFYFYYYHLNTLFRRNGKGDSLIDLLK